MRRQLRTSFDLLKPLHIKETVLRKQQSQVEHREKQRKGRLFHTGGPVLACHDGHGSKWVPATVIAQTGPVSYTVQTGEGMVGRRHVDQLLAGATTYEGTPLHLSSHLPLHKLQ